MKNKTIVSIVLFISQIVIYIITRFLSIIMHNMKDFSEMMALVSCAITCILILENKLFSASVAVYGSLIGFIIGLLFNTSYLDMNGSNMNNMWLIWLISYIIVVLLGMVIERLFHVKHR